MRSGRRSRPNKWTETAEAPPYSTLFICGSTRWRQLSVRLLLPGRRRPSYINRFYTQALLHGERDRLTSTKFSFLRSPVGAQLHVHYNNTLCRAVRRAMMFRSQHTHEKGLVVNESIERDRLVGADATRRRSRAIRFLLQVGKPRRVLWCVRSFTAYSVAVFASRELC